MIEFFKSTLKVCVVLAISIILTYILLTLWSSRLQISFSDMANKQVINSLDEQTINGLETTVASGNLSTSILFGILITLSYIIIANKKLSTALKLVIGYFSIIIIFPLLYMFSFTGQLGDIRSIYESIIPRTFYTSCTIIFVLMYFINYKINSKLTDELNEMLQNKESTPRKVGKSIVIMLALTVIILLLVSLLWFAIDNYNKYTIFKESIGKVKSIQENGNYYYETSASDYFGNLECKMWVKGKKVKLILSLTDINQTKYYNQAKNRVQIGEDNSRDHTETYYIDFDEKKTYCVDEEQKNYQMKNELALSELKLLKYPKTYRILANQDNITFLEFISHIEFWESSRMWTYNPDTKEEENTYFYRIGYRDVKYQIDEKININKEDLLPTQNYSLDNDSAIYDLVPNCVKDEDVTFNNINEYKLLEGEELLFKFLK